MREFRANDVFKPGSYPKYTYVTRKSTGFNFTYEMRLKLALNTPGYLTSIVGPSKTGKTVLCEKVIGLEKIVSLTGSDFKNQHDFWRVVANKVGLSLEGEYLETTSLKGTAAYPEERSVSTREKYLSSKDKIIQYFQENNLVLIIDDFHYAPDQLQLDIAYQLKDAIRREFKVIVISLPHRADDAIRKNPDLSGRLNLINIEPWKEEELKEIAITGYKQLGIEITDDFASKMAVESLTSPQLMQSICLNLAIILNVDNDHVEYISDPLILEESYRFTTINLPYQEVVKKLTAGPPTRGQGRKKYQLKDGDKEDIYHLLIRGIALDPPVISIDLDGMKKRIDQLTDHLNDKIDKLKIKNSLKRLHEMMQLNGQIYQVFEWKDNQMFILDPLFLFYIRWGNYE